MLSFFYSILVLSGVELGQSRFFRQYLEFDLFDLNDFVYQNMFV